MCACVPSGKEVLTPLETSLLGHTHAHTRCCYISRFLERSLPCRTVPDCVFGVVFPEVHFQHEHQHVMIMRTNLLKLQMRGYQPFRQRRGLPTPSFMFNNTGYICIDLTKSDINRLLDSKSILLC